MNIECKSNSTKQIYKFHIDNFIKYCNSNVTQDKINPYLNYLVVEKRYKPSSLGLVKYSLIYYFTKILHQQIIVYIPLIKKDKKLPMVVSKVLILKMIDVTTNLKHKIIIELLYSSGIRLSELYNLKWQDIDYENRLVRVNKGKGAKDRLSILSQKVVESLKEYQSKRKDNNSYIFINDYNENKRITKRTIQQVLRNACKKLNLNYIITPHQLRHSLATHLVENDVNLRKIQILLGHSNLNTTKIYTQVAKNDLMNIKNPLDY